MRCPAGWCSIAALLLLYAGLVHAEQLAELSDEFLEYLGSLEGDDENWTDFTAVTLVASKQSSSSKSVAAEVIKASSASSSAASVMSKATTQLTTPASGKAER